MVAQGIQTVISACVAGVTVFVFVAIQPGQGAEVPCPFFQSKKSRYLPLIIWLQVEKDVVEQIVARISSVTPISLKRSGTSRGLESAVTAAINETTKSIV